MTVRQIEPAAGWVQRGKQFVFDKDLGLGQPIHQGRFARIGIPDQSNTGEGNPSPVLPMQRTGAFNLAQFAAQGRNALANTASVHFKL